MTELVFIEPGRPSSEPFTTSEVVAMGTGVQHRKVRDAICRYRNELETFGKLAPYQAGFSGGRGRQVDYILNEQQATLLVTLMKNTPAVVAFKTELVRQFYAMRQELEQRKAARFELKPVRRSLTDVIAANPEHSPWDYNHYTNLAYLATVGMSAAKLRRERGAAPKARAVDYLTADELTAVTKAQERIAVLYDLGLGYEEIKQLLLRGRGNDGVA